MDNNLPLYLFHQGTNYQAYKFFGSHKTDSPDRWVFRVYAPHAGAVSVVGDFNGWNNLASPMRKIGGGVWEAYVDGVRVFDAYKYCVTKPDGGTVLKADPYAFHSETNGATASKIYCLDGYTWHDEKYLKNKRKTPSYEKPVNIYEVHLGSWRRHEDGNVLSYTDLADQLSDYAVSMGYTHVELMPVAEYPYDGSWGYQVTGFFSVTSRFGTPHDFMYFVDKCHEKGLGVIVDWVPAHFPRDEHGLAMFDGTKLYEHDTLEHKSWGTLTFDYAKNEVKSFLISNAIFMHDVYHVDGLRVDAVASMLYLDYDRRDGEWKPNKYGDNKNLEAIEFLRQVNTAVFKYYPHTMMIAEESTAFPLVSKPADIGGLGFNFKWNMGWMNDTFDYFRQDPFFRKGCHNKLTFSFYYAFSENFVLPVSHDEVVHGKRSLIEKMPGDYQQKFANLRLFFAYMMAHPGKKLTFMGQGFAQFREWNYADSLEWFILEYPKHRDTQFFVKTLNEFYLKNKTLYEIDFDWQGFEWIVADDNIQNVLAFKRKDKKGDELICVFNLGDKERLDYKIGVDEGKYRVVFNTDDRRFGGEGRKYKKSVTARKKPMHGKDTSISLTLPPLTALFMKKTVERRKKI